MMNRTDKSLSVIRKPIFWIITILIILICGIVILFTTGIDNPPLQEIHAARKNILLAKINRADTFASELYQTGAAYYDSAMISWKTENHRFVLFRDFQLTNKYANKSFKIMEEAVAVARKRLHQEEKLMGARLELIGIRIEEFDMKYSHFPLSKDDSKKKATAKMMFHESESAWKQCNFDAAKLKMDSVEQILSGLFNKYDILLNQYMSQYRHWDKTVRNVINQSKMNHIHCVVIDKYFRKCRLYKNGLQIDEFDIELGNNWIGDKIQQGDKATPEGIYKIKDKKSGVQTRYYKALLLDYPNEEDKKRFKNNKKHGIINENATIGNLIEIHGYGGKGADWTNGCVALRNDDMDRIYEKCIIGTPVVIVGSTKSMKELDLIFNEN